MCWPSRQDTVGLQGTKATCRCWSIRSTNRMWWTSSSSNRYCLRSRCNSSSNSKVCRTEWFKISGITGMHYSSMLCPTVLIMIQLLSPIKEWSDKMHLIIFCRDRVHPTKRSWTSCFSVCQPCLKQNIVLSRMSSSSSCSRNWSSKEKRSTNRKNYLLTRWSGSRPRTNVISYSPNQRASLTWTLEAPIRSLLHSQLFALPQTLPLQPTSVVDIVSLCIMGESF